MIPQSAVSPQYEDKNNDQGPASRLHKEKYSFHSSGEGDAHWNNAEIVFALLPLQTYLDVLLYYQIWVWVTYLPYTTKCCPIWIYIQIKLMESGVVSFLFTVLLNF